MKNGIELIALERQEQIEKHGRTVEQDVTYNKCGQLTHAAATLLCIQDDNKDGLNAAYKACAPLGWDAGIWLKMVSKPQKDRLIIAGALIAAEIDRINNQ